jgi:hypothetical protein
MHPFSQRRISTRLVTSARLVTWLYTEEDQSDRVVIKRLANICHGFPVKVLKVYTEENEAGS